MALHPIAQQMLDNARASGHDDTHLLPIDTARAMFEEASSNLAKPHVAHTFDVEVPTRDGARIRGRVYVPATTEEPALTVYYHGGGWLLGSIESHDVTTRLLANAARTAVLSVDYRRGPENRFPTAVNDAIDALRWATSEAADLRSHGIDVSRIAVAGDSAGGNLAGAVAIDARDNRTAARIRHQLLIYPVTTCDLAIGFDERYEGVILGRDVLKWYVRNYLRSPEDSSDVRSSILNATHTGLPETTVILAECDPIKPQGRLLVHALEHAGVPTAVREYPGMMHGFFGFGEFLPAAAEAVRYASDRLAAALSI